LLLYRLDPKDYRNRNPLARPMRQSARFAPGALPANNYCQMRRPMKYTAFLSDDLEATVALRGLSNRLANSQLENASETGPE
jgi:hypothetical protein